MEWIKQKVLAVGRLRPSIRTLEIGIALLVQLIIASVLISAIYQHRNDNDAAGMQRVFSRIELILKGAGWFGLILCIWQIAQQFIRIQRAYARTFAWIVRQWAGSVVTQLGIYLMCRVVMRMDKSLWVPGNWWVAVIIASLLSLRVGVHLITRPLKPT
jgi:hypothetical protein